MAAEKVPPPHGKPVHLERGAEGDINSDFANLAISLKFITVEFLKAPMAVVDNTLHPSIDHRRLNDITRKLEEEHVQPVRLVPLLGRAASRFQLGIYTPGTRLQLITHTCLPL
ncbi:hypothetical protein D4764_13G0008670 [Takifugu flavidus]|uniref:Uncharacterized protein n=1 Tax=Takifugu flavidus TaxID=433684 RepID=A0A5C6P9U1_9TELE|nr:hypothetical protein D4764_13G0008670 [Takifugu flavidus]